MRQITKDQHFVPQLYLKRFAREGQLQVFDVRAKRIGKSRSPASVCYRPFFYAAETGVQDELSQALEALFSAMEDIFDKAFPGIINRAVNLQLNNDDVDVLAYFMTIQWFRTSHLRERLQKMYSEAMKWQLRVRASLPGFQDFVRSTATAREVSDEQIEKVKRLIQSGKYEFVGNAPHLNFITEKKINIFRSLLLAKKWRIILSEGPHHFITSDNPVVEWIPLRTRLIPVTFMERTHLFALTPSILIETVHPDSMNPEQQPVDRLSYHTANGKGVLMFNKVLANHTHQFAYAPQTDEFEQLLKAI